MPSETFEDLSDAYEAMLDWPKRLANEQGFYRWLFQRVASKSVLDAACGTGHHAAMFHSWGLRAEGADISQAMIQRCREHFGESENLRWVVRRFDQPTDQPGSFDVAICVGNSLALARDTPTVAQAIQQMFHALRPAGAILIHILNLWHLPDGPCVWHRCKRTTLPQGDSLIIKGVHRAGKSGYLNLLVSNLATSPPTLRGDCVPFLGLETTDLEHVAQQAGATHIEFFGSYQRRPYDRQHSQDLIMVAIK